MVAVVVVLLVVVAVPVVVMVVVALVVVVMVRVGDFLLYLARAGFWQADEDCFSDQANGQTNWMKSSTGSPTCSLRLRRLSGAEWVPLKVRTMWSVYVVVFSMCFIRSDGASAISATHTVNRSKLHWKLTGLTSSRPVGLLPYCMASGLVLQPP